MLFATSIKNLDVIPTFFEILEFFFTNSLSFNAFSDEISSMSEITSEMAGSHSIETSSASSGLEAERTVSDGSNRNNDLRNKKLAKGISFFCKHPIVLRKYCCFEKIAGK